MEHDGGNHNEVGLRLSRTGLPRWDQLQDDQPVNNRQDLNDEGDDKTQVSSNSSPIQYLLLIGLLIGEVQHHEAHQHESKPNNSSLYPHLSLG